MPEMSEGVGARPAAGVGAFVDRHMRGLICLNAALVGVLGLVTLQPSASAQAGNRAAGQYTMVGGQMNSGSSNAVWIVDAVNREMVVVRWDQGGRALEGIGYRSIVDDQFANPSRR